MVHDPAAAARLTRRRAQAAGCCALATLLVAGCGSGDSANPAAAPSGALPPPPPARSVNCAYWRAVDRPLRLETVRELRRFAGGPVGSPAGHGAVLDDQVAYRVIDDACGPPYATHFKLYKLYTRAAAFGRH